MIKRIIFLILLLSFSSIGYSKPLQYPSDLYKGILAEAAVRAGGECLP